MGVNAPRHYRWRIDASGDRGLHLDPVTVDTEDGQTWDGLALIPHRGSDPARRRLGVIVVHGSVGSYISGVPRRVSHGLARAGFTVVSVNTRMAMVERASGPTSAPVHSEIWTYRTWWHSRGPEARHAVSAEWVGQIGVPLALIQAGDDMIVPPGDGDELAAIARAADVPDVRLESVPYANHVFSGREQVAVDRCVAWLEEVVLRRCTT